MSNNMVSVRFRVEFCGIAIRTANTADGPYDTRFTSWSVPYWLITVPLTVVTGWLLSCKPRVKNSDASTPLREGHTI